jgi:hypothetical protein
MTETTTRHTPGPWEAMDSGLIYAPPAEGGQEAILICDVGEIDETTPDRAANALVIAAAPDMLAALHLAESIIYAVEADNDEPESVALAHIRAVIAKAEPQQAHAWGFSVLSAAAAAEADAEPEP